MRWLWISALGALGVDQATKIGVVFGLDLLTRGYMPVWPPYLNFLIGWNRGINFGLFGGGAELMRWLLVIIAVGVAGWIAMWARRGFTRRREYISAGLVIGGALGNALDRVVYGAVADFLNMSCCGIDNPFTFNLADVFIFAGAMGLIVFTGKTKTP